MGFPSCVQYKYIHFVSFIQCSFVFISFIFTPVTFATVVLTSIGINTDWDFPLFFQWMWLFHFLYKYHCWTNECNFIIWHNKYNYLLWEWDRLCFGLKNRPENCFVWGFPQLFESAVPHTIMGQSQRRLHNRKEHAASYPMRGLLSKSYQGLPKYRC